jgi:hypothetical protein
MARCTGAGRHAASSDRLSMSVMATAFRGLYLGMDQYRAMI